jgi:predicted O-methyltransferase YrrM
MSIASLVRIGEKALLVWDVFDPSPLGHYRRLSRPVDGWLTRDEESELFQLARAVPREQAIVELGSWFGRSAILLGGGSLRGKQSPVFSVDLFRAAGCARELLEDRAGAAAEDYWDQFQAHIHEAGLERVVTALRGDTAEIGATWSGPPVALLFIDADHSYEGVRRDWSHWRVRLAPHAVVAFHDYGNPAYEGVARFADELAARGAFRSTRRHDSLLLAEVSNHAAVP